MPNSDLTASDNISPTITAITNHQTIHTSLQSSPGQFPAPTSQNHDTNPTAFTFLPPSSTFSFEFPSDMRDEERRRHRGDIRSSRNVSNRRPLDITSPKTVDGDQSPNPRHFGFRRVSSTSQDSRLGSKSASKSPMRPPSPNPDVEGSDCSRGSPAISHIPSNELCAAFEVQTWRKDSGSAATTIIDEFRSVSFSGAWNPNNQDAGKKFHLQPAPTERRFSLRDQMRRESKASSSFSTMARPAHRSSLMSGKMSLDVKGGRSNSSVSAASSAFSRTSRVSICPDGLLFSSAGVSDSLATGAPGTRYYATNPPALIRTPYSEPELNLHRRSTKFSNFSDKGVHRPSCVNNYDSNAEEEKDGEEIDEGEDSDDTASTISQHNSSLTLHGQTKTKRKIASKPKHVLLPFHYA